MKKYMSWLDSIKFDEKGLIPTIAQDHATGRVLMVAWMNRESLSMTAERQQAVYFSRSRNQLWHKGETSGHFQQVHDIRLDCDGDVIVLSVTQLGGIACHTGRESCFYRLMADDNGEKSWQITDAILKNPDEIYGKTATEISENTAKIGESSSYLSQSSLGQSLHSTDVLQALDHVLTQRKNASPDSSYVASLYHKGINKILEKVGEETTETIIAAKDYAHDDSDDNCNDLIYEVADVWFHTMVTLAWFNLPVERVTTELARRFGLSGIDEKNARMG